nr:unnamed protein product [Callosobruchus chinensis]
MSSLTVTTVADIGTCISTHSCHMAG